MSLEQLKASLFHEHNLELWKEAERAIDGSMQRIWRCRCGKLLMEPTHYPVGLAEDPTASATEKQP